MNVQWCLLWILMEREVARRQVVDSYQSLRILAGWSTELARRLSAEGRSDLAATVSLVGLVARQQGTAALEAGWTAPRNEESNSFNPKEEWAGLDATEAATALCEELVHSAEILLLARDLVPADWAPLVLRTTGSLLVVAAQLREGLDPRYLATISTENDR